jgi:ABC-2 type transport system ATP-binding protein
MNQTYSHRIQELQHYLENADLSLLTRRLMDVCNDYKEAHRFLMLATGLRKQYNALRGLGEGELRGSEKEKMLSELNSLMLTLTELEVNTNAPSEPINSTILAIQQITKSYQNKGHEFDFGPVDLELKAGQITGIVGENGNGKTTLLRMIAKDLAHYQGVLTYPTLSQIQDNSFKLKQHIGFIPQRLKSWSGTLIENLKFSAAIHGMPADKINQRVDFVIHRLGLSRFQYLKLRFELAKTLVWNPKILVLDEPIANLDLYAQQLFLQDLGHIANSPLNPISIVLSSQQLHEIEEVSDQIVFLRNGKPIFIGNTSQIGSERKENSYMITGDFTYSQVLTAIDHLSEKRIEFTGKTFTVHVPLSIDRSAFLKLLIEKELIPEAFRDISHSTRKLLSDTAA